MGKFLAQIDRDLTLTVRQMAWLNATPRPDPRTKRGKAADQPPAISRIDRMKKDKIQPKMPPNPMPHVIDRLIEIGLTEAAGMGSGPISWRSIAAWVSLTGVDLSPWEARLIRRLSAAYVIEGHRAESENCPPPWKAEVTQREIDVEQARLEDLLG